jgi:hypothetical protein
MKENRSKIDFRAEGAGIEPASARETRSIISRLPYQLGVTLRFKGWRRWELNPGPRRWVTEQPQSWRPHFISLDAEGF